MLERERVRPVVRFPLGYWSKRKRRRRVSLVCVLGARFPIVPCIFPLRHCFTAQISTTILEPIITSTWFY